MNNVTIISSKKNWLEQNAVDQIKHISTMPGVLRTIGLPDLHPGKTPVGCTIITENIIYPHLIGNDIGCGMSLYITDIEKRKVNLDKMIKKAEKIFNFKDIPLAEIDNETLLSNPLGSNIGTIGGGNHFAELQEVDTIYNKELFNKYNFNKNQLMLLIHSGSRAYGQAILDESIKLYSSQKGLTIDSEGFKDYLTKHDDAIKWASINRDLISYRFQSILGKNSKAIKKIDSCHNSITTKESDNGFLFFHRKGAAPSDNGILVIPGSRGSLTYLVQPNDDCTLSGCSLAHGAGRKWERSMCKSRLQNKYTKESITSTNLKGRVICNDKKLLFEEAPEAYKNINTVIQSLIDYELINIIATFKPLLTYKG